MDLKYQSAESPQHLQRLYIECREKVDVARTTVNLVGGYSSEWDSWERLCLKILTRTFPLMSFPSSSFTEKDSPLVGNGNTSKVMKTEETIKIQEGTCLVACARPRVT